MTIPLATNPAVRQPCSRITIPTREDGLGHPEIVRTHQGTLPLRKLEFFEPTSGSNLALLLRDKALCLSEATKKKLKDTRLGSYNYTGNTANRPLNTEDPARMQVQARDRKVKKEEADVYLAQHLDDNRTLREQISFEHNVQE